MSRFTKKELKDKFGFYPVHTGNSGWVANEATDKLGKLEDLLEKYGISDSVNFDYLEKCIQDHDKYGELQEQIGCPLEVVFKAITHGIAYELKNGLIESEPHIELTECGYGYILCSGSSERKIIENGEFQTKDYKKTWWLKEDKSE